MSSYGTVLDPMPPSNCAPTDRACLHREHFARMLQPPPLDRGHKEYYCPPNAACRPPGWKPREKPVGDRREPLITTAGITDQWWFFPAVAVGAWWLFSGRK